MPGIAIIGGGLCGPALARSLNRQGRGFALFEARPQLGGRILTVASATSGLAIDLGATWFWPDTQPHIARLVADLALASFPQHDEGPTLRLNDPDRTPEVVDTRGLHNARLLAKARPAVRE